MIKFSVFIVLACIAMVGLCAVLFRDGKAQPEPFSAAAPRILDMHCHVAGIGAGGSGAFISEQMRRSWKYRIYLKSFGISEEELRQHGDGLVIKRLSEQLAESKLVGAAVVLALDGVVDEHGQLDKARTESYVPNDFVARETAKYTNLYFGASVNPYRFDALERLEQARADGALLIKWLPAIQHIDPADERLIPFYEKLVELDLPLLTHAGDEHSFTRADNSLGDPLKLRLPLGLGVKVIAAHVATSGQQDGQDNMERLLPFFKDYPNLYADVSSLTQLNKVRFMGRLRNSGIAAERLLYGTDFPLIRTGLTSPLFSLPQLGCQRTLPLLQVRNAWGQDVRLKLAYGLPAEVFSNAAELLLN